MLSTSFSRTILPFAAVAIIAGCGSPDDLVGVAAPEAGALSVSAGPATATGSGHFTSGGELRSFALSAVGRDDGSASGEYQIVIHAIDRFLHVGVTCMVVRNDTAWVAGIITKTNHPAIIEGTVSYFWAVDGGEGEGAVDKVSIARINDRLGEDRRFCSLTPDEAFSGLPGRVVEKGNVQISGR